MFIVASFVVSAEMTRVLSTYCPRGVRGRATLALREMGFTSKPDAVVPYFPK